MVDPDIQTEGRDCCSEAFVLLGPNGDDLYGSELSKMAQEISQETLNLRVRYKK